MKIFKPKQTQHGALKRFLNQKQTQHGAVHDLLYDMLYNVICY